MQPSEHNGQRGYTVHAVARACDILTAFRDSSELVDLGEIAKRSGVGKVTVFRILSTLAGKGLVEKVGPRAYRSRFKPLRQKRYLIGYAAQSEVVPFIGTVTGSVVEAVKAADLDLMVVNNRASRSVALRNADLLIERKVDLVLEFQRIADVAPELAKKFSNAGIPLVAIDTPHPGAVYFGADNYKAGHIAGVYLARWAVQHWDSEVEELVIIQSVLGGPALDARALGAHDGVVSVLPRVGKLPLFRYDTQARYENTLDAVRKHLRHSRARRILVAAVNAPSTLAVLEAFREFGREEQCAVVGQDACIELRQEMRRPHVRLVGSVAYFPECYGERLVRLAMDILENRPHPSAIFTQHRIITPENVDKVYPNDLLMNGQTLTWPR
jgi:ribose transport system substrate-binding protein